MAFYQSFHFILILCMYTNAYKAREATRMNTVSLTYVPEDLLFLNTMPQKLACLSKGYPTPKVTWMKDNSLVRPKDGVLMIKDGALFFNSFKAEEFDDSIHDARYRCQVSSSIGSIVSREINVKAVLDTRYSPIVYHQSSPIGGTAIFKCHLPPEARDHVNIFSWKAIYPGGAKKRTILKGMVVDGFHALMSGDLVVTDVIKAYSQYQFACVSQNALSNVTLTSAPARLFPNVDPVPFKPRDFVIPTNQVVYHGETIVLECEASSYPYPTIIWYKASSQLVLGTRIKRIAVGSLKILKAEPNDAGEYSCTVDYQGNKQVFQINVTVKTPLQFKERPMMTTVSEGETASLRCSAVGSNPLIIEWRKNGVVITPDDRISMKINKLDITDTNINDEGVYQCVARNQFEEIQTSARLIVQATLPSIESPPEGSTLTVGATHSMNCKSNGQPSPDIKWWFDGKVTVEGADPKISVMNKKESSNTISSVLIIKDITTAHSGVYRCVASNRVGEVDVSATINVEGKPVITDFLSDITGMTGKSLLINCRGKAYPKVTTSWFKDGIQLQSTDRVVIRPSGSLFFKIFRASDSGSYLCKVGNKFGEAKKELKLNNLDRPRITPFSLTPTLVGDRAQYLCTTQDRNDFKITWYKDGVDASKIDGISVIDLVYSKALTFEKVTIQHGGRYTCTVENKAGRASYSADFIIYEKPSFTATPIQTSVLNSHPIMLPCSAKGFPQPQITWFKRDWNGYDQPVFLDHRIHQLHNGTLFIGVSQAVDNGVYICKASFFDNKLVPDPLFKEVKVVVRVPAKIIARSPYKAREKESKTIHLTCSTSGTQSLSVKWFKNGLYITDTNKEKYEIYNTMSHAVKPSVLNSTLQIRSLISQDNGLYECLARNSFGLDKADFKVLVEEKPHPPVRVTKFKSTSRTITIKWKPGFDGNSQITSHKIEMKEKMKSWNAGHYFIVVGNGTTYKVEGLKAGTAYSFRLSSKNKHGSSEISKEFIFTTREEAPSGPPLNISVSALSKNQILVEWKAPQLPKRNGKIVDYQIHYIPSVSSNGNREKKSVQTQLTHHFVLDGLDPFTTYNIQVQAFTKEGGGPLSPAVKETTLEGVPQVAPSSVTLRSINSRTLLVSWKAIPINEANGILQGYKILYTDVVADTTYESIVYHKLQTQLTGLKKFTLYKIRVLAFTKAGDGEKSNEMYQRTDQDVPGKPSDFTVTPNTPSEILVSWNPPKNRNGIISNYILYYKEFGESIRHRILIHRDSRSQMLRNLAVGKDYVIWMTAKTARGEGEETRKLTSKTEDHVAAKIMTPSGWTVTARKGQDVELPCLAIGYPKPYIKWKKPYGETTLKYRRWLAKDRPLKLFDIDKKDEGLYNCTAENDYGAAWNAVELIVQVPPGAPMKIRARLLQGKAINITWKEGRNGNSKVIQHHINYAIDKLDKKWNRKTLPPTQTWFILQNVTQDIAYFQAAAENNVGIGTYSQPFKFVITGNEVDVLPVTQVFAEDEETESEAQSIRRILQPVLISVVVIATIILILLFIASWDKDERRMRKPRCYRLCCLSCCKKCRSKGEFQNEPYSEPGLLWPWHNVKSQIDGNYDYNMTEELLASTDDQISFRYRDVKQQGYNGNYDYPQSSIPRKPVANSESLYPRENNFHIRNNSTSYYNHHPSYEPVVMFKPSKTPESSISYKSESTSHRSNSSNNRKKKSSYDEVYDPPPPMIERYLRSQEDIESPSSKQLRNNFDDDFNNDHRVNFPDKNNRDSIVSEDSVDMIIKEVTDKIGLADISRGSADGKSVDNRKSPPEYHDIINNYTSDAPRVLLRGGNSPTRRARRARNRKSIDSLILRTLENIEEQQILSNNGTQAEISLPQAANIIREMLGTSKSYDSVSSTCSSSVGELKRAFEFGKKYGLQSYEIPQYIDPLEDSDPEKDCSNELDYTAHELLLDTLNLTNFSEKPKDLNDMKIQIPLPVRLSKSTEDIATSDEDADYEHDDDSDVPDVKTRLGIETGQSFV